MTKDYESASLSDLLSPRPGQSLAAPTNSTALPRDQPPPQVSDAPRHASSPMDPMEVDMAREGSQR